MSNNSTRSGRAADQANDPLYWDIEAAARLRALRYDVRISRSRLREKIEAKGGSLSEGTMASDVPAQKQ